MRSIWRRSSSGSTWLPKPCDAEWSVIAMYVEPEVARRERHLLGGVAPVGQDRVHVEVAAQVGLLDQHRHVAGALEAQLAAVLAQLGRDPRQPEERVDLLLGRAAVRLAGRVVEDAVLGDVQAAADDRLAQRHVVVLRAGEVLHDVAELVGLDDAQVERDARVRARPRRVVLGARRLLDEADLAERGEQRGRVGRGRDDVEVLDRVDHAPRRARELDAVRRPGARAAPRRSRRRPRAPC